MFILYLFLFHQIRIFESNASEGELFFQSAFQNTKHLWQKATAARSHYGLQCLYGMDRSENADIFLDIWKFNCNIELSNPKLLPDFCDSQRLHWLLVQLLVCRKSDITHFSILHPTQLIWPIWKMVLLIQAQMMPLRFQGNLRDIFGCMEEKDNALTCLTPYPAAAQCNNMPKDIYRLTGYCMAKEYLELLSRGRSIICGCLRWFLRHEGHNSNCGYQPVFVKWAI